MGEGLDVKGISFTGAMKAFARRHGETALQTLQETAPGDLGQTLRAGGIIASQWYPVGWYSQLLATMLEVSGKGIDELRVISREAVADDFRTLFRLARALFSPQTIAKHAMRFSQRYYSAGTIDVVSMTDNSVRFRFSQYQGFDRRTWTDMVGGCEGVFVAMGCVSVESQIHAGGTASFLEATFSFVERGDRLEKPD